MVCTINCSSVTYELFNLEQIIFFIFKVEILGLPWQSLVNTLPSNAGDVSLILVELRPHMPHGLKAKMWNRRNIVMGLIKIFKMIHIKKKKKTLKNKKKVEILIMTQRCFILFSKSFPLIPSSIYTLVSLFTFFPITVIPLFLLFSSIPLLCFLFSVFSQTQDPVSFT